MTKHDPDALAQQLRQHQRDVRNAGIGSLIIVTIGGAIWGYIGLTYLVNLADLCRFADTLLH